MAFNLYVSYDDGTNWKLAQDGMESYGEAASVEVPIYQASRGKAVFAITEEGTVRDRAFRYMVDNPGLPGPYMDE
jgi:hypothetical protein